MRRWIAVTAGALAALTLTGCTALPDGVDGNVTNGWSALPIAAPFTPTAGTCHLVALTGEQSDSWHPVPCTKEHVSETAAVGQFTGATATATSVPKTGSAAERQAYQDCSKRVAAFVGGPWRSGRIAVQVVLPSQAGWSGGARWYRCEIAEVNVGSNASRKRKGTMSGGLRGSKGLLLRCFNSTIAKSNVEKMTAVACTKKHNSEFAGLWTVPKGVAHRTVRGNDGRTAKACHSVIATFAGLPDDNFMQYRTGWIGYHPSKEDWDRGDRQVQCFLWLSPRSVSRSMHKVGTSGLPIQRA